MTQSEARTVVLIGAARSGTKLLRDLVAAGPGASAVPYDVNFVWRQGVEDLAHDELPVARLTPSTRRAIRRSLERHREPGTLLVEKTVSNALRIPWVEAVLPEAHYLHVVRDGRDVVESVVRQWTAPVDLPSIATKLRAVPSRSLPRYGLRYASGVWSRLRGQTRPSATWGPRYDGIVEDLRTHSTLEVCARQWQRCVRHASAELALVDPARVTSVTYEELVRDPVAVVSRIREHHGLATDDVPAAVASAKVRDDLVGAGRRRLSAEDLDLVEGLLGDDLARLGYQS